MDEPNFGTTGSQIEMSTHVDKLEQEVEARCKEGAEEGAELWTMIF